MKKPDEFPRGEKIGVTFRRPGFDIVFVRRLRILLFSLVALLGLSWWSFEPLVREAMVRSKPVSGPLYNRVPILLFHNLDGSGPYSVTRQDFKDRLDEIRSRHLKVIPLRELLERSRTRRPLDQPSVVITIDDDFENIARVAAPLLREYGYPATLFVYIKDINNHPAGGLSWDDLRRLHREGFEIQNHSWTHGVFHKPAKGEEREHYEKRVTKEIATSRKVLEEKIPGNKVYAFAFPMGYRSPYLESRLHEEGYEILLTTEASAADLTTPFSGFFHRFTLESNTDPLHPINRILYLKQLDLASIPISLDHNGSEKSETAGDF